MLYAFPERNEAAAHTRKSLNNTMETPQHVAGTLLKFIDR